ncbi:MAG: hypothetical protein NTW33_01565 [Methanoregula sp.]|nr:hypothetical protein [Methanoregula sp.]
MEEQVIIGNALPDGWSDSFTNYMSMPKMSPRRSVNLNSGGGILEWIGGSGGGIIAQPDGTMRLEERKVSSSVKKSSNVIVPTNIPVLSPSEDAPLDSKTQNGYQLYSGVPVFTRRVAVLFDSSLANDAKKVPGKILLKKLEFTIKDKTFPDRTGMYLLLYIEDSVVPRVKVFLKDLLQHKGHRPLNIQRTNGELLKIVLIDPDGKWDKNAPAIGVVVK